MKVELAQEHLTVSRFPGGPAQQRRVWYDQLAACEWAPGTTSLVLRLTDGEVLRVARLGTTRAGEVTRAVEAILADRGADRAPLDDLGAVRTRALRMVELPGYSPRRLLEFLAGQAAACGGSDLHLGCAEGATAVELRRDGTVYPLVRLPAALHPRLLACLKLLAGLPAYRKDVPQEGSFAVPVDGATADVRLSILPSLDGEHADLRIFDPRTRVLALDALGFDSTVTARLRELLACRSGLLVVAGPSGSGKTTTAYALLRDILASNGDRTRIASVEDPIEARVPGVQQAAVNLREGLDYERLVSHLLRHDADVLLLGEARDRATAAAAVQAALTGHLVVTTVHCASALEAFERMTELGVARQRLVEATRAVLSQRLLRRACTAADHGGPAPCPRCLGTGYDGRSAVAELLEVTPELRRRLVDKRSTAELAAVVRASGLVPLIDAARARAAEGWTTDEEARRCTA